MTGTVRVPFLLEKSPSNEERNDPHHVFLLHLLPQEDGPCFRSEPPQPHTSSPDLDPDQGPRESKLIILFLTGVFLTLPLTKFHIKTRENERK